MNHNPTRFRRHRESPAAARILYAPPQASTSSATEPDLTEDEIFNTGNDTSRHQQKTFSPPENENSGILAALPTETEIPATGKINPRVRNAAASFSSSSSSSSSARMIPLVPRPPERLLPQGGGGSGKFYPQSAPVDVPIWAARRRFEDEEVERVESESEEEEGEGEVERLPPHEIVARSQTPRLSSSVFEGVGRTLKGRDLRQVRNAVWRKTGFLD